MNIPHDSVERVRPTLLAGLIVLLLLGIAVLNLPLKTLPFPIPYIIIVKTPVAHVFSEPNEFTQSLGRLKLNQQADLISQSSDGQWYKIKYENRFGWISSTFAKPSVDQAQLPIDAFVIRPTPTLIIFMGAVPATQTPWVVTPTKIPVTLPAFLTPNLVLGEITFTPPLPLTCFKRTSVSIEINNLGGGVIPNGKVTISDSVLKTQSFAAGTFALFGPSDDHQLFVNDILFGGPALFGGEVHRLVITVNPDRWIPETNYDDNSREFTYTLQGDC